MRTFKDILSVPQLFIFKLNHKYNLPLHLIIYNNDSVDVLPITSRCISDQVTKFPIRSRHDEFPIKSRSVPTKYVRSRDVFRTTYETSDLIRIRIGSEGATDSSVINCVVSTDNLWRWCGLKFTTRPSRCACRNIECTSIRVCLAYVAWQPGPEGGAGGSSL